MTRETKAGLVVSCSFLCLVGVVLVTKLRERAAVQPDPDVASMDVPDEPTPAPEGTPVPPAGEEKASRPVARNNEKSSRPAAPKPAAPFSEAASSGALVKDMSSETTAGLKTRPAAETPRKEGAGASLNGPDLSVGGKRDPLEKAQSAKAEIVSRPLLGVPASSLALGTTTSAAAWISWLPLPRSAA